MHVKEVGIENLVLRMEADVKRALQKPFDKRHWVMVIDLQRCIGCNSCTVACKAENGAPPGVIYNLVMEEEIGQYPNVRRRFTRRPCMQCEKPPCTKVCPVKATYKLGDGIVYIDYEACIGCRYCLTACPYGARTFDWGEYYTQGTPVLAKYELAPSFEYGRRWVRKNGRSPMGNARKCHFCLHRVNNGLLPACVTTCLGRATYFGDRNDPDGLVASLIGAERAIRLKEELGTKPSVYYLV